MGKRISERRRVKLLAELVKGERDAVAIAEEFALSWDEMVYWVNLPENWLAFTTLCRITDAQAQVAMSRFRLHAATRLAELATTQGLTKEDDVSRRACVDLLKTNLGRSHPADAAVNPQDRPVETDELMRTIEQVQREMLSEQEASDDAAE